MEISVSEFKAKCLRLVEAVETGGETIVITRHGHPAAKLVSVGQGGAERLFGRSRGKVKILGDLVETGEFWDAER